MLDENKIKQILSILTEMTRMPYSESPASDSQQWTRWFITAAAIFAIFSIIGCVNRLLIETWYWVLALFISFLAIALIELIHILYVYIKKHRKNACAETMDLFHRLSARDVGFVKRLCQFEPQDIDYSKKQYTQSLVFLNRFSIKEKGAGFGLIGLVISSAVPAMKLIEEQDNLSVASVFPMLGISLLCFIVIGINNKLLRPNQVIELLNFAIRYASKDVTQEAKAQDEIPATDLQHPLEKKDLQAAQETYLTNKSI